ncbi:MAG: hypothetical protein RRC07_14875 [Anaerolineae bacterium]|nr:hypothetical protein [Anaerolineae bacterium]
MRLTVLEEAGGWQVALLQKVLGFTPSLAAVRHYRPEFFGKHYAAVLRQALRRGEAWSRGDLELMAAFVSSRNQCEAATRSHGAVAALYLGKEKVRQVLGDYLTAPISEPLRATLVFVEKVTLLPSEVGGDDIQRLRRAGISEQGIREALLVCFVTAITDRLAESFGFEPAAEGAQKSLAFLSRFVGYRAG